MNAFYMLNHIPVHVSDTKTEKKPLVLLHGYLETLQIWDTFNLLTEDAFRVIAPDLPGHGLTGTYNVNTVEKQADMLFEYLERQQIGTVLLAGHSMGGYVAQSFAMRYPGKVSALVLMHAVPWPDSDEKKAARDRDIEKIRMGKLEQVAQRDVPLMYAPGNRKRLNEIIESTLVQAGIHDPAGIVASLKGMKERPSYVEFLHTLACPLVFFFGTQDSYISMERAMEMEAMYPHARVIYLHGSGHNGFVEEPHAVAETLRSLI